MNQAQIRPWTEFGRRRREIEVKALKREFDIKLAATSDDSTPTCATQQSDHSVRREDRDQAYNRWALADNELASIRVAQPPPPNKNTGQTGHQFRICYVDHPDKVKNGTEESLILGGPGEQWEEGDLRVVRCDSPLGKALVGARKGDERTVHYPDYSFDIEIVEMTVPNLNDLGAYVDTQTKERLGLPNGNELHT